MSTGGASRYLLALLFGAGTTLSFAPVGAWPIGLLTLAGLFYLWQDPRADRAALTGFCFGLGLYGSGVSWVYISMHDYGAMPAPLAALATLLFAAYLALWPALAGYTQARLPPRAAPWLAIPATWCLTEWLRGWVFTGFPWLGIGYAHTDGPLAGLAPLVGVHGINFAAALVGVLAAAIARGFVSGTPWSQRLKPAAALTLLLGGSGLSGLVQWAVPHQDRLRVALLQGNVSQDLKFEEGRFEATLETYRRMIEAHPATLVVLPETALPRMLHSIPPRYLDDLENLARARGANLVFGVPLAESQQRYFNSVVTLGISPRQRYDKAHLVPFGEFIPPGFRWFVDWMKIPLGDFTRGASDPQPITLGAQKLAINICYEDLFGEEIIAQLPAATLLVNVSNIAWFGDSLAPHQHLQISRMRSLETARPMLRATNTGMTAVIDHQGRVLHSLRAFTTGALVVEVQPTTGLTPYVRGGNWPAISASALALLAALLSARLGRQRRGAPGRPPA